MTQLRKFIAGAACPSCKQVDKLFVTVQDGVARISDGHCSGCFSPV